MTPHRTVPEQNGGKWQGFSDNNASWAEANELDLPDSWTLDLSFASRSRSIYTLNNKLFKVNKPLKIYQDHNEANSDWNQCHRIIDAENGIIKGLIFSFLLSLQNIILFLWKSSFFTCSTYSMADNGNIPLTTSTLRPLYLYPAALTSETIILLFFTPKQVDNSTFVVQLSHIREIYKKNAKQKLFKLPRLLFPHHTRTSVWHWSINIVWGRRRIFTVRRNYSRSEFPKVKPTLRLAAWTSVCLHHPSG